MRTKIKDWIYNNILSILPLLPPFVSYVVSVIKKGKGYGLTWLEIALLVILTVETVVIVAVKVWNRVSYRSHYYPRSKIKSNYELLEKSTYYQMNENNELVFSRTMIIKSNIDNLRTIFDKFIWTGTAEAKIPTPKTHIQEIKPSNRIGIWRYFEIVLDSPISKGEEIEIHYEWPVIKDCKSSSPFFSTSTDEPTKKVVLALKLGRKYSKREIILEEYRAIESDNPISKKRVKLDHCGDYTWKIDKPKRFRYYRVRWEWSLKDVIPEVDSLN